MTTLNRRRGRALAPAAARIRACAQAHHTQGHGQAHAATTDDRRTRYADGEWCVLITSPPAPPHPAHVSTAPRTIRQRSDSHDRRFRKLAPVRRAAHSAAASLVPRRAASHTEEADDGSPQETAMLALLLSCCVLLQPKPVTHTGDCSVAMSRSKGRERKHAHTRPVTGLRRRRAPSFSK